MTTQHTLKQFIKNDKKITVAAAALELGLTRQTLYNIFQKKPALLKTAKKIETWSGKEVKASDLTCPG